jgi:hypothetical protein
MQVGDIVEGNRRRFASPPVLWDMNLKSPLVPGPGLFVPFCVVTNVTVEQLAKGLGLYDPAPLLERIGPVL